MARKRSREAATRYQELVPLRSTCECCGGTLWIAYRSRRTITTLDGLWQLLLTVRRCHNPACERYRQPCRPEEEGRWALPHGEFGLDIIALIGALRYEMHRSVPEIHQDLRKQGQAILAPDGLQPDVGHKVLWVLRDCLSGEVLLARSLLSTNNDLEQYFGSARYHERRATGRKVASPSVVVRGAVRVVAGVATGLHHFCGGDLQPTDIERWYILRDELDLRQQARRAQFRFRRDPGAYLTALEDKLLLLRLPP